MCRRSETTAPRSRLRQKAGLASGTVNPPSGEGGYGGRRLPSIGRDVDIHDARNPHIDGVARRRWRRCATAAGKSQTQEKRGTRNEPTHKPTPLIRVVPWWLHAAREVYRINADYAFRRDAFLLLIVGRGVNPVGIIITFRGVRRLQRSHAVIKLPR